MKKSTILLTALLIALTACGSGETKAPESESSEVVSSQKSSDQLESSDDSSEKEDKTSENKSENNKEFKIGEPVELADYVVTVKSITKTEDSEGKPGIKIVYDLKNNAEYPITPMTTVYFEGFQDGMQTEGTFISDDIDYDIALKEVKGGTELKNIETGFSIEDEKKPLKIELSEIIDSDSDIYSYKIDDISKLK